MAGSLRASVSLGILSVFVLAACEEGAGLPFLQQSAPGTEAAAGGEVIERDVEAPDVFSAQEAGLWDGRPSLGGVWVAHPDVTDPERVLIRNENNGDFVIGALFRRERNNPGPRLQVSSDAAEELGMLAGQPTELNVVALRRETITVEAPEPEPEAVELADAGLGDIEEQSLDPVAAAAAAIEEADPDGPVDIDPASISQLPSASEVAAAAPATTAKPARTTTPVSSLERPYVQIGIFSVKQNAENTGASLRNIGIVPTILEQSSKGKTFWRVIVGPAATADERRVILGKVKELGFGDAYFVTN